MKQKHIGNKHVYEVKEHLLKLLSGEDVIVNSTSSATASYIFNKHSSIKSISSKFDHKNPDKYPDLTIHIENNKVPYHLFSIKNGGIQPRNLGGKSFLSTYFQEDTLQERFNIRLEQLYIHFYRSILKDSDEYTSLTDLRKEVKNAEISFSNNDNANKSRKNFLFSLRENALEIFYELLNTDKREKIISGLNYLLFNGESMLIAKKKAPDFPVIETNYQFSYADSINVYRKGNDSIGFTNGTFVLFIRFKFESQPHSPIKLTTSLGKYESTSNINTSLILRFEKTWNDLIANTHYTGRVDPNSVGKINEALIYHYLLQNKPTVISDENVKEARHIENIKIYGVNLPKSTLKKLNEASKLAVENVLLDYIKLKYPEHSISAISLTDDAYRLDIRDNSDIKLILKPVYPSSFKDTVKELGFSLKANARSNATSVVKNPGFGKILGPNYFKIGDTENINSELKDLFQKNKINHNQVLIFANQYLAESLSSASVETLKYGLATIIGKIPIVHTFYEDNNAKISGLITYGNDLKFEANYPTKISNSIFWNNGKEQLIMRVKFEGNHSKGWTSLKLVCTYKIRP